MASIISFLNFLISVYMLIITFRIILTWFSGFGTGGIQTFLSRITDPYLNWFRRFSFLRVGVLDLSPIAALCVLSMLNRILSLLAIYKRISLGIILSVFLQAAWGALSFILGFLIVVLILRLIASLFAQGSGNPFWRAVEGISQPVVYRINRILFKDRIVNFFTALIVSIVSLALIYLVLRILFIVVSRLLAGLPF